MRLLVGEGKLFSMVWRKIGSWMTTCRPASTGLMLDSLDPRIEPRISSAR